MDCLPIKNPIYIVSKGRWETTKTANIFLKSNIEFLIAVEPQEYDLYKKKIPEKFILKLPFSNLGMGSYPARNFCWEHSISNGYKKHFLFDDNIQSFARLNNGKREYNYSPRECLFYLNEFMDRFSNIAICGYNYAGFVTRSTKKAFAINKHVYSGMLINNEIPFRWRLKYNEDVDLCLQVLHTKKWCTVLMNAFLIDKTSTVVKQKGGNQTELYQNNDEKKKALKTSSLVEIWPQYVKNVYRFNRPHHFIDWNKHFPHPLKKI